MRKTAVVMSTFGGGYTLKFTPTVDPSTAVEGLDWDFQWLGGNITAAMLNTNIPYHTVTQMHWGMRAAGGGTPRINASWFLRLRVDTTWATQLQSEWNLVFVDNSSGFNNYRLGDRHEQSQIQDSGSQIATYNTIASLDGYTLGIDDTAGYSRIFSNWVVTNGADRTPAIKTALEAANPSSFGNLAFTNRLVK